jgi:hypothetical protein
MKIRKHTQYTYVYNTLLTIFRTPLHPDTMSDQVGQTDRKSTHNSESTLGLAAASNLQRLGVESSNEKNNL